MAKYEDLGFCPHNSFTHYMMEHEGSANANRALSILGPRIAFMVYDKGVCTYNGDPYVVDAICGATDTTGIEIATAIKILDPICEYPDKGLKLSCYDTISPYQIPGIRSNGDKWTLPADDDNSFLFEDERYLNVIVKDEEEILLYFWKK